MLVRGSGRGVLCYEVALEVAGCMDWTGGASSHRMSHPTWMGRKSKSSQSPQPRATGWEEPRDGHSLRLVRLEAQAACPRWRALESAVSTTVVLTKQSCLG